MVIIARRRHGVRFRVRDGEVVLAKYMLRFPETPLVHHWDSMMAFDETTRRLFLSDLFIQRGATTVVLGSLGNAQIELGSEVWVSPVERRTRS